MPGLEDRELPTIPKSNDSLGGESGLEKLIRPFSGFDSNPPNTVSPLLAEAGMLRNNKIINSQSRTIFMSSSNIT